MPYIQLQSCENEAFVIDMQAVEFLGKIRKLFENGDVEWQEGIVIAVPKIKSAVLRKIIEWATYHKDHPVPIFSSWDVNFLKAEQQILPDLIVVASYLENEVLLEIVSKIMADMLTEKTTEEMRKILKIKNDFNPEEEEKARRDYNW